MTAPLAFAPNHLYYGDCLEVLGKWPAECVDLVYLDPPFNSAANYNVLYGSRNGATAQVRAFSDTWHWDEAAARRMEQFDRAHAHPARSVLIGLQKFLGESGMLAYLSYMAERLQECRRVMRSHGSLFLHCDPTASHYLKLVCDGIFGPGHFRNEIIWRKYTGSKNNSKRKFPTQHDVLLFYARSESITFNVQYGPIAERELERKYRHFDEQGRRYRLSWGRRYQQTGEQRRIYLDEQPGVAIGTLWTEGGLQLNTSSQERLGYPTQKPVALLTRVIRATTNEGDIVLDPFCGCGTTIAAAEEAKRRWVGVDVSPFAVKLVRDRRLRTRGSDAAIMGIPTDMEGARMLLERSPLDFEVWAVTSIPGLAPNQRRVGDRGIDGRGAMMHPPTATDSRLVVAQVKGGGYNASAMRDFQRVIERENAAAGVYVTLRRSSTPGARRAAAELGTIEVGANQYPRLQLWSVEEFFEKQMPRLPDMADPYTGQRIHQPDLFE